MADDRSEMDALRTAAEARVRETVVSPHEPSPQYSALVHELQVHQIELEMQNEVLRNALIALEAARDRHVDLFDFAPVAYLTVSRDGRITEANFPAAEGLGVPRSELVTQPIDRFIATVDIDRWHRQANAAWQAPGTPIPEFEILLRNATGLQFPAQLHCMARHQAQGLATMRIALLDNTERSAAAAEMLRLANYDALTQLPNRRLFQDRLEHAVVASRRNGMYGAILFLDLDNFKSLNDTRGHDAGDQLLIEVAYRLRSSLREGDTVARIGGDEFVMILEGLGTAERPAAELAKQVADKLNQRIAHRVTVGTIDFRCTTSIGVRLFSPGERVENLLKQADLALYQAKSAGRNQVRLRAAATSPDISSK